MYAGVTVEHLMVPVPHLLLLLPEDMLAPVSQQIYCTVCRWLEQCIAFRWFWPTLHMVLDKVVGESYGFVSEKNVCCHLQFFVYKRSCFTVMCRRFSSHSSHSLSKVLDKDFWLNWLLGVLKKFAWNSQSHSIQQFCCGAFEVVFEHSA